MRLNRHSSSTQIYIDQINNYIEKGQGYEQLRVHLLKQLNQIDSENPNSDETLVPVLCENLRIKLLADSSQLRSRTIDVIQDLITYADDTVQSSFTNQAFTLTILTAVTYKIFNPFTKSIFDQNRLRLCSIILHYYQKFQSDPSRYFHVLQAYKQLKQKNFTFPEKSFIIKPKVNEFKKQKIKDDKSQGSDIVGVKFDHIVQFVKQAENFWKTNPQSCANTQFVRALKLKAKTLFDLSQNTQGVSLSAKDKELAKDLYRKLRTILKEIEKINETKIKQQKIKSQKQFAKEKIEHITPKKKQLTQDASSSKKIQSKKSIESGNLLDDITAKKPETEIVKSPVKAKQSSLLDVNQNQDEFTQYATSGVVQSQQSSKSIQKSSNQGLKLIKKPPKTNEPAQTQQQAQLIDSIQPSPTKKSASYHQASQLKQTVEQRSTFSKKSIHSVASIQSNKGIKLANQKQQNSKAQNDNILDFDNQKHYSKLDIINSYIDPNCYNTIPNDIDFSDSSSQKSEGSQRVTFDVNKNNFFVQDSKQPYDRSFLTPKKQASCQEGNQELLKEKQRLSLSANMKKLDSQKEQLVVNQNFGILADAREVKAYDYGHVNQIHERSSFGDRSEDQERKINLNLSDKKQPQQIQSMKQISPQKLSFGSQKDKKNEPLQIDRKSNASSFEQYQQVKQQGPSFMQKIIEDGKKIVLDGKKALGIIQYQEKLETEQVSKKDIFNDRTPEKNTLVQSNENMQQ